jgi:outer membrane protein insertion porin family
MNKKFLPLLSLVLFTCAPLTSTFADSAAVEAYEDRTVAHIDVSMENLAPQTSFDPKTVVSRLKTQTGDPFSQLTFDTDLKMLAEEYDRVEPYIEVHNGEVYISLKIWPKLAIRAITWHGNEHIKTKALKKELDITPNTTFNRQAFNKAFNKVKEYYIKKGYFESELRYTLIPDPKTNQVDIEITVQEGRSGRIDNIIFKGFTSSERSQLLDMIYTKKYSLLTSWLTGTGVYHEEALDQDNLTIVNFLQNKGYADAHVDIQIREAKTEGKIIIEINAERGPVYHFGKITFDGNELFTDEEIENRFLVRPEDVYSPEKLRETMQAIKEMYGRKGHIDATVQYETQLVENEPIYNVHFQISEGEQYTIGIIRVFGNTQTQTRVILHESLLIPGETFDSAKLKATQQKLENIGYFKQVNVYAVRTQDDEALGENYRDVYIEVEETTTGNMSLFFGFSTADSIFGGLDIAENNFNYRGFSQIFSRGLSALRGGGEYAHARVSIGSKQRTYSLSWLTPYFRDTLWRVGFEIAKTHSELQSKDYDIDTLGGTLYASYPLSRYWSFGTKYRARYSNNPTSHGATREERKQADISGVISAIGASLNFDSTDSHIKPHNGFRSMTEVEFAGVGGDFSFFRFGYLNTYYTSLWRRGIMKYRFDFRFIEPFWKTPRATDVPLSERFFLGGETSVRGYRAFDLGPHFSNGDPTGGISASLFSVEYLHEIFRFLDGFVFADAGSVSLKRFYVGNYKLSYGFGARIDLINRVPMTVGMGFPVNPDSRSEVRKFFFSMGGQF